MFKIYFADETANRTATRKTNAVKIAERDGALYVESPTGEVVWGDKPARSLARHKAALRAGDPADTKPTDRKPYRLEGQAAAADEERAAAVALAAETTEDVEMIAAEEIAEGDVIVGRRTRDARREVAEVRVGKKWVTAYDEKGHPFVYAPLGSLVPRVVA